MRAGQGMSSEHSDYEVAATQPSAPRMSLVTSTLRSRAPDDGFVAVDMSPFATVGILAFDAIQREDHFGTPPALRRAIVSRMRRRDIEVLSVLARTTPPKHLIGSTIAPS